MITVNNEHKKPIDWLPLWAEPAGRRASVDEVSALFVAIERARLTGGIVRLRTADETWIGYVTELREHDVTLYASPCIDLVEIIECAIRESDEIAVALTAIRALSDNESASREESPS